MRLSYLFQLFRLVSLFARMALRRAPEASHPGPTLPAPPPTFPRGPPLLQATAWAGAAQRGAWAAGGWAQWAL